MDTEVFDWGYPVDLLNYKNGSWIKIKKPDGSIIYDRILAVSLIFPRTVQFTRLSGTWDASITSGSEVTPVCVPDTAANPTLTDIDGHGVPDLRFVANTGADAFPPRKRNLHRQGPGLQRAPYAELQGVGYRKHRKAPQGC